MSPTEICSDPYFKTNDMFLELIEVDNVESSSLPSQVRDFAVTTVMMTGGGFGVISSTGCQRFPLCVCGFFFFIVYSSFPHKSSKWCHHMQSSSATTNFWIPTSAYLALHVAKYLSSCKSLCNPSPQRRPQYSLTINGFIPSSQNTRLSVDGEVIKMYFSSKSFPRPDLLTVLTVKYIHVHLLLKFISWLITTPQTQKTLRMYGTCQCDLRGIFISTLVVMVHRTANP